MPNHASDPARVLDLLGKFDHGGPSEREKLDHIAAVRRSNPEMGILLDQFLIHELTRLHLAFDEMRDAHEELRRVVEKAMAPPWAAAAFIRVVPTRAGERVLVAEGGNQRLVEMSPQLGVRPTELACGQRVYLNGARSLIVDISARDQRDGGEVASVEEAKGDGRVLLRFRGEQIMAGVDPVLAGQLRAGDQVRFSPGAFYAFEKVERPRESEHLVGEVPEIPRHAVGGQDRNLDQLLFALTARLLRPELASQYGVAGRQSVLISGPPGCGKTLMVKVAASELTRLGGAACRVAVVKPAEWESPYVGETQERIRRTFEVLNGLAAEQPVILYLDEVESIGRARGLSANIHADKFLGALLAELDGFAERTNIAVVSSTNRPDILDGALMERLSDIHIRVGRPDRRGARAIFEIHLAETLPYSPNGSEAPMTRTGLIDLAVSRLYAPNADNEVATVKFRDGKGRVVHARELVSGRLIEQVCRAARRAAFARHQSEGMAGIRHEDIDGAVADSIERMRTTLTTQNVGHYLDDIPQDIGVVAVEPVRRHVTHRHRYVSQRGPSLG